VVDKLANFNVRQIDLKLENEESVKVISLNESCQVVDKDSLMLEFYQEGSFGEHFGGNWDALIECLTETSLPGVNAVVYLFYHYHSLKDLHPEMFDYFVQTFVVARESSINELHSYDLILVLVEEG